MAYNLVFARKAVADGKSEYWGYKLDGNNQCVTRTIKTDLRSNSRVAFLEACKYAVTQIGTLMEFREIPQDTIVVHVSTALYWKYLMYFDPSSDMGIKPPKEYFDMAYETFQALENLSCGYTLQLSPWATASALVTERAWKRERHTETERASDVFNAMPEED